MKLKSAFLKLVMLVAPAAAQAAPKEGEAAPDFHLKTHEGKDFHLKERAGQWTVLYFYPKASTPGCTKQACAFRDNISKIREQGAEVFGISTDEVAAQAAFHEKQQLNFVLLSDPDASVTDAYGAKMPIVKISKRWTFVIDPELRIRALEKNVDPVLDADRVAKRLKELKEAAKTP